MRTVSRVAVKAWLESISEQLKSDAPHAYEQANEQLEMARADLERGFTPLADARTGLIVMNKDCHFYETVSDFVCEALFALRANKLAEADSSIDAALKWVGEQ